MRGQHMSAESCKINAFIKVVRKILLLPVQFERSDFNSKLFPFLHFLDARAASRCMEK